MSDKSLNIDEFQDDIVRLIKNSNLSKNKKENHLLIVENLITALLEVDEQMSDLMCCLYILERNNVNIDIAGFFGSDVEELYDINHDEVQYFVEEYYTEVQESNEKHSRN